MRWKKYVNISSTAKLQKSNYFLTSLYFTFCVCYLLSSIRKRIIAAVSLGCSGIRGRSATITWLRRGPKCVGSTLLTKHSHVLFKQEDRFDKLGIVCLVSLWFSINWKRSRVRFNKCVFTDWQQSRGKSSLYRRPVRSVVIIFTLTELMCLEPISLIRAITLVNACTQNRWTLLHKLSRFLQFHLLWIVLRFQTGAPWILSLTRYKLFNSLSAVDHAPASCDPSLLRWSWVAACWRRRGSPAASAEGSPPVIQGKIQIHDKTSACLRKDGHYLELSSLVTFPKYPSTCGRGLNQSRSWSCNSVSNSHIPCALV